ncbi:hypothetical protein AAMO2058_000562600 [Amorphochlora amoebiformis]
MTFAKLLVVGAFLASALDLSGSNSRSEKVKGSDIPASAEIPKNAYEMGCYKPLRRLVVELHSFPSNESLIGAIRRCKLTANIDVDLAKKALTDASLRATCIPGRRKKIKGGSFASDVMSAKHLRIDGIYTTTLMSGNSRPFREPFVMDIDALFEPSSRSFHASYWSETSIQLHFKGTLPVGLRHEIKIISPSEKDCNQNAPESPPKEELIWNMTSQPAKGCDGPDGTCTAESAKLRMKSGMLDKTALVETLFCHHPSYHKIGEEPECQRKGFNPMIHYAKHPKALPHLPTKTCAPLKDEKEDGLGHVPKLGHPSCLTMYI